MTEQEFSELFDAEEQALLADLGDTLRAEPPLQLPADFARQTARTAEQRFRRLPALNRLAVRLESVLAAPVASRKAFPLTLALSCGTLFAGALGQDAFACLGLGLMATVCCWKLLERFYLPPVAHNFARERYDLTSSFYLLPLAGVLLSSAAAGLLVTGLSLFSLTAKKAPWDGAVLFGPVVGVAVLLYLLSALVPTWKALFRQCLGRTGWAMPVQLLHALWAGILGSLVVWLYDPKVSLLWVWAPVLLLAFIVSFSLGRRVPLEEEGRPALWRALGKTTRSLLIGGMAIGGVLVGAYETSLTRQIDQPELYESTRREVSDWVKAQQAIPAGQNGWTELRVAMTHRGSGGPQLLEQMKAGSVLYEPEESKHYWERPDSRSRWMAARDQFLRALPVVRSSLARPYFSSITTEGFTMQSGLPNLMAARSVSRGLAALTADAVGRQQTEEALGYLLTNLAWSKKMLPGGLINLMVSVAQQKVALDGVEAWLYEAHPNTEQLHRLLEGLRAAEFDRLDLLVQMKRELYLADVAFTQLLESGRGGFEHLTEYQGWRLMVRLMPRSYWRSEHKALINLLLSNQSAFGELGKPGLDDPTDLLPYSFAARQLVPVNSRAQAQFMLSLTRFKALQADVALELYRREHGSYPDSLDQLVPAYLPELPVNVGSPKLWGRKPPLDYRRLGNSFRLEASSPVFETIRFKARQQFGPDGLYHLEESAR